MMPERSHSLALVLESEQDQPQAPRSAFTDVIVDETPAQLQDSKQGMESTQEVDLTSLQHQIITMRQEHASLTRFRKAKLEAQLRLEITQLKKKVKSLEKNTQTLRAEIVLKDAKKKMN